MTSKFRAIGGQSSRGSRLSGRALPAGQVLAVCPVWQPVHWSRLASTTGTCTANSPPVPQSRLWHRPLGKTPGHNPKTSSRPKALEFVEPLSVGEEGLEPSRPEGHWHLKPARLPFRHSPRTTGGAYHGRGGRLQTAAEERNRCARPRETIDTHGNLQGSHLHTTLWCSNAMASDYPAAGR